MKQVLDHMMTELALQAEKSDPDNHIYPSNLSAALYEVGDYLGCIHAICRAWKKLPTSPEADTVLIQKWSLRLGKALRYGAIPLGPEVEKVRDVIEALQALAKEGPAAEAWKQWVHAEPRDDGAVRAAQKRFVGMSKFYGTT